MNRKSNDLVAIVNEHDQVIGTMDKIEAHRGEGKLHRASSVFLFRYDADTGAPELLVQQRSDKKIVGAKQWANTVCGNVWPEESYEACARRRLAFELGINAEQLQLTEAAQFRYQAKCNQESSENEIVHIFVGSFDDQLKINEDEVAAWEWVNWQDINVQDNRWAPWFKLFLQDTSVKSLVEQYANR